MSAPNFIYIGPDKAGSSWLHEVLLRHPQVYMPEAKDLYFFDRYYDRGLDWYLGHFEEATARHLVVGEVCQDYLFEAAAPARMRESLGSVRTMVTLRDPADRAFSSYLYMLKQGERPGTFLEALSSRPELLDHGRYATGLARYTETFGPGSVHVAVFDDLTSSPQCFIDKLTGFLGIEPMLLDQKLLEARLPAARARLPFASRLARAAANVARERLDLANFVGRVKRSSVVQRVLYVPLGKNRPVMTDDERRAVHDALGDEIAELDRTYGLGLAGRWGWDLPHVGGRAEDASAS